MCEFVLQNTCYPKQMMMINIPRKHEVKELQKNSHIGHCTHTSESTNVKSTRHGMCRKTLHVAQTVNTEQLSILYEHDLFQVYNCKYPA